MGHSIAYLTVDKREDILMEAREFAFVEVDRREDPSGSYHGRLTIHDHTVLATEEEARQFIDKKDNGWYDDHAVQYRDTGLVKPTSAMTSLSERMERNRKQKVEYNQKHQIQNLKSKKITCRNCQSNLNKDFLHSQNCPVCRQDLRADYIVERLNKYDEDYKELGKKYRNLEHKLSSKAPVKWLVKVEVHV